MKHTLLAVSLAGLLGSTAAAGEPTPEQVQFFESKVRPLLAERCHKCHGPQKQQGGLRLDSAAALRAGGDSGPVIVPGKPQDSLLLRAVNHEGPKMPPKEKLRPEETAVLAAWIKDGAPWPQAHALQPAGLDAARARKTYWAFQPIRKPPVPRVRDAAWPLNDVDRFILSRLEARGLVPVEPADKPTLLRRATFDLTGLPPTPEEIAAFLADDSPAAFARVVDRLLASPAYGERWGRHWLDLVRYADTAGDNSDYPVPQLYRYRNWVIRAFNQDKPYDQFLREQVAGDLLSAADERQRFEQTVATGYLANTRRFGSYADAQYQWYLTYEDTIDNLGRTVLGLTVNCARCHDHKFDPISMEDYYGLYGIFQSTRYPWPGIELDKVPHDLVPLVPPEQAEPVLQERERQLATRDAEIKRLTKEKAATDKAAKAAEPDKAAEARKKVEELAKAVLAAKAERERFAKAPLPFETAYSVAEKKKVGNARLQLKGDPERPGKEVPRKFLGILGGQTLPPDAAGSGRLELADWLTDLRNPLPARVLVNRIWQHHFGRGIVPTPSDFGKQGKPPSHPELLDYLAAVLLADGGPGAPAWGIKKMHRLIILSRTYQLSSRDHAGNAQTDPDNESLWRFNRRRLDAESIRDALLVVSGALDRSVGGPHPFPDQTTWDFTQHKPFKAVYAANRRSVYLMTQRIQRHPYLALFDGADPNASTAVRVTSTTPLQALYLMNDPFVHEQARRFAGRLLAERPDDAGRAELAYVLAFGRPVLAEELSAGMEYLARVRAKLRTTGSPQGRQEVAAWESYARALLLANEIVYVQ
jgi:hypothetical protein